MTGKYEEFNPANLDWADKIIVYEDEHEEILKEYGYKYWGKSFNFGIQDVYFYWQPELVALLRERLRQVELM